MPVVSGDIADFDSALAAEMVRLSGRHVWHPRAADQWMLMAGWSLRAKRKVRLL